MTARRAPQPPAAGGKGGPQRPRRWSTGWRGWVKRLGLLGVAAVALGGLLFAYAYAATDVPDPNEGFETQTSYVYYADGRSVLGRFAEQNRTSIPLSEVPRHVQDAVIAAEDRSFRTHRGIDPKGILRAAFNNARGGSTQGASTITQQYVKVLYLTQDRTWSRKAKEAILSLKIQQQQSKDEILEGYLNTIYFGRGAYGIEAAARAYFNKPARALTVPEGAALSAIINSPTFFDPAGGTESRRALKGRYDYVIDGMREAGALPADVGSRAITRLPEFPRVRSESQNGGQRGHVLTMVKRELGRLGFTESEIYGGGLRITTTFTKAAMAAAEQGVRAERPDRRQLHVAAASVEPATGALRGVYAGQDFLRSQINWAVAGGAPGSAFKPFGLAAGLDYGYSLESVFNGDSPLRVGDTEFNNQGEGRGQSYGTVDLLTATEKSINTAYVELVASMEGGPQRVIDTAVRMGVPERAPGLEPVVGIILGSATISPVDMANAYGTIADGGKAKAWYVVERVEDASGRLEFQHRTRTSQVISAEVAADTSYALQQVTESGTGVNANVIGRPVAGKTGTATTDAGRVRSSWFVGYTPQLSTAVMYVRGDGNKPLDGYLDTFYGGEHPARTWAEVMQRALAGAEVLDFPPPALLEQTAEGHEPVPTFTPEPSPTRSATSASPTRTQTPSPTPTETPSETPSATRTPTPTPTRTEQPSPTGSPSGTPPPGSPSATASRTAREASSSRSPSG